MRNCFHAPIRGSQPAPTADTLDVFFQTVHAARLVVLEATERDVLCGKNARRG